MKGFSRSVLSALLIVTLLSNARPCGPGYVEPLFDVTSAPEVPYTEFAGGKLGIIKPKFRRSVLYAAFRWVAGNGLSASEQAAIIDVWRAEFQNKDFRDDSVEEAVKAWLERRKEIKGEEEKIPDIYTERPYGGYEFFPNCTKNAFETAAETLVDRYTAHSRTDPNVLNWLTAQDAVFSNCASGKTTPEPAPVGAPEWLHKDRAYQLAAASFYSLDYDDAKRRFVEIAQDTDSPWAETADYLVARTLIRQASLSKDPGKVTAIYEEAEEHLRRFVSRSSKFSASAERLTGLIKYRLRPKERVSELAKKLTFYADDNFRQDLIDYNWLLDKFENEVLTEEAARKAAEEIRKTLNSPPCTANSPCPAANARNNAADTMAANDVADTSNSVSSTSNSVGQSTKKNDDDLTIYFSSEDLKQHFVLHVRRTATDEEAVAEAERLVGSPLNEETKKRIREGRRSSYAESFTQAQQSGYQGGYYGEEKMTPSLMPDFLKQDALTDWLFTYQTPGAEAYLYSLKQFREGGGDLWLMTALSKAERSSTHLTRLIEDAQKANRLSPAYPTIAYHTARILLEQGKTTEARTLIDEMIGRGDQLPISAQNSFIALRLNLAQTLEDFLRDSLKRAYAFDFDGDAASVDEIIARQKTYFDPEYNKEGREAYEREIEEQYREQRLWQERLMFDSGTMDVFNQHFPTVALIEVMRSPALPEYLRERFAIAIWSRAFLLNDAVSLQKLTPELAKYRPEFAPYIERITSAKTAAARENALLWFVLKNPLLSPYLEEGMGKTDNESGQFESNDWWCQPYDMEYSNETNDEVPRRLPSRPAFLTVGQSQAAQSERKKLKEIGDAPKFLAARVMAWAKRYPTDRRVPEALYIMIEANGWTKYGCGNNEELREEMMAYLKRHHPNSEWVAKLAEEQ